MKQIELNAFAKINLSIDVIGKRSDGYHDVLMVLHQINLRDTLDIEVLNNSGDIIEIISDMEGLPKDENNIAWKAAKLMRDMAPIKSRGDMRIKIAKKIPMASGLAGGSADAAAVLHGLNLLWGCGLSIKRLMKIGANLGADVPFCIMGQAAQNAYLNIFDEEVSTCALAEGIGEKLTPLSPLKAFVVLSKPGISILTGEIYKGLNLKKILKRPKTDDLVKGLCASNFDMIVRSMENVLEEVSTAMYPLIEREKECLYRASQGKKTMMTGSGPTVFTLFEKIEHAQLTFDSICKQKPWVFLGETSSISS